MRAPGWDEATAGEGLRDRAALDVPLYVGPLVTVGRWRCPVESPHFVDSGPAGAFFFCFPRTAVWIQHAGHQPFVADPNVVTFYNKGQEYRRRPLAPEGDHGDWFAVAPAVIAETLAAFEPAAADRHERPFAFTHGPSDPATYLLQRAVFEHASRESRPDALFIEETVLAVLERLAEASLGPEKPHVSGSRGRDLSEAARAVLASRFPEGLTLSDIAASVDTSVFHLARVFRRETGTTLHAYRNQLRLRTGLERLADAGTDLLDLALSLGYSSHSHFTESFRRAFGETPSMVRGCLTSRRTRELVAGLR
ncbi:MAG: helix-turn-helix transcriptional regulator [Vicinamibacterales bacterium]